MRFVATADLQIGMPAHGLGDQRAAFALARIAVIDRIARIVHDADAAALVIAGDLFDREPVAASDLARTLDALREIEVPILVLPGNHDSHHPTSVWRSEAFLRTAPNQVTVLLDEPVTIEGFAFHGAPLLTRTPDRPLVEDLLATLEPPTHGSAARVVVGHGAVDAVAGDFSAPSTIHLGPVERALDEGRARFVVLGDRHSTRQVDAAGRVWYPGAPEPTDFGDDEGHVLVVDLGDASEEAAPVVERHRTGTWRFVLDERSITDLAGVERLLSDLSDLPSKATTVAKVRPHGAIGTTEFARLEAGLDDLAARLAVLDPRLERLAIVPGIEELAALPLPAYARTVANELVARVEAAEGAGTEDREAADELRLLLRFAATVGR